VDCLYSIRYNFCSFGFVCGIKTTSHRYCQLPEYHTFYPVCGSYVGNKTERISIDNLRLNVAKWTYAVLLFVEKPTHLINARIYFLPDHSHALPKGDT
jgi:hypothetical protein